MSNNDKIKVGFFVVAYLTFGLYLISCITPEKEPVITSGVNECAYLQSLGYLQTPSSLELCENGLVKEPKFKIGQIVKQRYNTLYDKNVKITITSSPRFSPHSRQVYYHIKVMSGNTVLLHDTTLAEDELK